MCYDRIIIYVMFLPQYLPKEEVYAPPLNIRILDKRTFGRLPMVGTHIVKSLKDFHRDPVPSDAHKAAVQGRETSSEAQLYMI